MTQGKIPKLTFIIVLSLLSINTYAAPNTDKATKDYVTEVQSKMTTYTKNGLTYDRGCVIRGPIDKKRMAIQITGGGFAEGGESIVKTLREHGVKATFYFTGDFYRTPKFKPLIESIIKDGHNVGPHGDKHLLYASWEVPPKLLVDKKTFSDDLLANIKTIEDYGVPRKNITVWNPAYQHYTEEIAEWCKELGVQLVNYTPGARTMADYMEDDDPRFLTAREMADSLYNYEKQDPNGLNGFIMHMHIGAGPKRTKDHFFDLLPEIIETLQSKGYEFVRVDELIGMRAE